MLTRHILQARQFHRVLCGITMPDSGTATGCLIECCDLGVCRMACGQPA